MDNLIDAAFEKLRTASKEKYAANKAYIRAEDRLRKARQIESEAEREYRTLKQELNEGLLTPGLIPSTVVLKKNTNLTPIARDKDLAMPQ